MARSTKSLVRQFGPIYRAWLLACNDFHNTLDGKGAAKYQFKRLEDAGWLELTDRERQRLSKAVALSVPDYASSHGTGALPMV